jgi:glycine/serine hydroxymethyltransferase
VSLGSPACTTRRFGEKEFTDIGNKIVENINELAEEAKLGGDN